MRRIRNQSFPVLVLLVLALVSPVSLGAALPVPRPNPVADQILGPVPRGNGVARDSSLSARIAGDPDSTRESGAAAPVVYHPLGYQDSRPTAPQACDPDGTQDSGAIYRICMPNLVPWNGELIVYAHGYVSPTEPVGIPEDQMGLPGGPNIATILNAAGYAFAATSYSTNGLAVQEGLADLVDLVDIFAQAKGTPQVIYLAGVSEGGLITALAAEQHPEAFDGGLAMCGPVGDFAYQVDHVGDFRAVFDYFFPGLMPGQAVEIPQWLIDGWDDHWESQIQPAIADPDNADKVVQLLRVTGTGDETLDQETREATIEQLLWFNVVGTNDALAKLGGQPYDNLTRQYSGSADDAALNAGVARFGADEAALQTMVDDYGASGQLAAPLVTLHTTQDPLVPHGHVPIYQAKVALSGSGSLYEHRDADAYGHCAFSEDDVWDAFLLLEDMVKSQPPPELSERVYVPLAVLGP